MGDRDPRECGFMGCGHPKCADACAGVSLAEWRTWRANSPHPDHRLDRATTEEVADHG